MDYIEVSMFGFGDFDPEIAMAHLSAMGFESFNESTAGFQAYIPEDLYNEVLISGFLKQLHDDHGVVSDSKKILAQNWNAIWESAYEPVTIATKCQVRAPFHPVVKGIEFDIVIEPKMSFGTAHHETTSLMLEMLLEEEVKGKRVLDMGCGTGVLAILAHKKKAKQVVAIDNDDWAYANATDNMIKNAASTVVVLQGDLTTVPLPEFDLIIANINRNVLLNDIPGYTRFLHPGGVLLMSGFYEQDLVQIRSAAVHAGLKYHSHRSRNQWVGAKFVK